MSNRATNIIAAILLSTMFLLAVFSMRGDSLTMDESAHLPAGYSYLTQKDMRLNPEHPPLVKDLAAIPLLFIRGINFPYELKDWKSDVNGQWGFGFNFLYNSGNPADAMIFWGRMPMILLLIFLGFFVFKWARELWGNKTALLSLFFYSFSPTLLAHGRLVTTDVGAATGVVIGTYYFLKALKTPTKKNIIIGGVAFGIAELLKFSLILLAPFFIFLGLVWWIIRAGKIKEVLKTLILVFLIGGIVIGIVYQFHVWNYPKEKQVSDTRFILSSFKIKPLSNAVVWMADKPVLRAYAQYLLGVFMIMQRAVGGNTTYFIGEVSASGWKNYFPTVYLLKETFAFHIFTLFALLYTALIIKRPFWKNPVERAKSWLKKYFPEFTMLAFVGLYWATSLSSNLNIGVRHLMPVIPLTILLVASVTMKWLKEPALKLKYVIFGGLILWQAFSVISIYPHFLAYFNEIAGGPKQGYLYTVDSNLDWGQDLKRLKNWVDSQGINRIYVDYFGGSDPRYYLKEKFSPWWGTRNPREMEKGSYLAVSATFLQGGRGEPVRGFDQPHNFYNWVDIYQPVKIIGYSIFVYKIDRY